MCLPRANLQYFFSSLHFPTIYRTQTVFQCRKRSNTNTVTYSIVVDVDRQLQNHFISIQNTNANTIPEILFSLIASPFTVDLDKQNACKIMDNFFRNLLTVEIVIMSYHQLYPNVVSGLCVCVCVENIY